MIMWGFLLHLGHIIAQWINNNKSKPATLFSKFERYIALTLVHTRDMKILKKGIM